MDLDTGCLVAELLDEAVANVAGQKFLEVTGPLTNSEKASCIQEAASSLNALQQGGTPDYDNRLVAAFYMLQYQLQHINLTYSMIFNSHRAGREYEGITTTETLHVVDYGCGALAMTFGVLLAAADGLEAGDHIKMIRIDSLDPAVPVVEFGVEIWERFLELVNNSQDDRLLWIQRAVDIVHRPHPTLQLDQIKALPNSDTWLSAVHVVYEGPKGNSEEVKKNLAVLHDTLNPVAGFLTTHRSKLQTAFDVSPFGNDEYRMIQAKPAAQFSNQVLTPFCTQLLRQFRPSITTTPILAG